MISEFPLFVFTLLGGMTAGAYILLSFVPRRDERAWVLPVVGLILLAISGVMLMGHLGRLAGVLQVAGYPTTGIGAEGYATMAFGLFVIIDLIVCLAKKKSSAAVTRIAGVFGLILLIAMGYAYFELAGIPQWGSATSFATFVLGGLALGASLGAFFADGGYENARVRTCSIVFVLLGTLALLIEIAPFAGAELPVWPFIIGAVLLAFAAVVIALSKDRSPVASEALVLFLVVVGMAIARYYFYVI